MDNERFDQFMMQLGEQIKPSFTVNKDENLTEEIDRVIRGNVQKVFSSRSYVYGQMLYTGNAAAENGSIIVKKGGIVYGPYISLNGGNYDVTFVLEAAENMSVRLEISTIDRVFVTKTVSGSGGHTLSLELEKKTEGVEFKLINETEQTVVFRQVDAALAKAPLDASRRRKAPVLIGANTADDRAAGQEAAETYIAAKGASQVGPANRINPDHLKKVQTEQAIIDEMKQHKSILFVGRFAPNKRIEDILDIFEHYYRFCDSDACLYLVGNNQQNPEYTDAIEQKLDGMYCAGNVLITGKVSDQELYSYYAGADVFLCMSEREGFCIPLLEAMHFNTPVMAYDAGAVSGTMGNSGILLKGKNVAVNAALLNEVLNSRYLRHRILDAQEKHMREFSCNVPMGKPV